MNTQTLTVFKQDHIGEPVFSWKGELLAESPTSRLVIARFSGADAVPVDKVTFCKGDLMLERYYTDRWYNLFEVHQGTSDQVKCWYINLSYPARFSVESITWQDLALDLVVYPNGEYKMLDEDEFDDLSIEPELRDRCLVTVREILANPGLIKPGLVLQPGR
jgi:protein associated with RNAse G/E